MILKHVDDWPEVLKKFTDSMPCVRCAFGFARYIFLELSTTYVTMSFIFLECVCFQHLISASFSIVGWQQWGWWAEKKNRRKRRTASIELATKRANTEESASGKTRQRFALGIIWRKINNLIICMKYQLYSLSTTHHYSQSGCSVSCFAHSRDNLFGEEKAAQLFNSGVTLVLVRKAN